MITSTDLDLTHGYRCSLPTYNTQWKGDGQDRQYNKYDHAFEAATLWWIAFATTADELRSKECVCKIAQLVKAIAWQESRIGYDSGFRNKGRFRNQPGGFIDTEDVMQGANPLDGPIHEKVDEIGNAMPAVVPYIPRHIPGTYSYTNIEGHQSVFYGVGWFFRKLKAGGKACSCDDAELRDALVQYNGNSTIDEWNNRAHMHNYAESVWRLYETGVYQDPATGSESSVPVWTY